MINYEDLLYLSDQPVSRSNKMVSNETKHQTLLDDLVIVDAALEHFRKVKSLQKTKLNKSKLKRIVECLNLKRNSEVVQSRWKKLKSWLIEAGETAMKSPHKLNVRKTEIQDYWESQL